MNERARFAESRREPCVSREFRRRACVGLLPAIRLAQSVHARFDLLVRAWRNSEPAIRIGAAKSRLGGSRLIARWTHHRSRSLQLRARAEYLIARSRRSDPYDWFASREGRGRRVQRQHADQRDEQAAPPTRAESPSHEALHNRFLLNQANRRPHISARPTCLKLGSELANGNSAGARSSSNSPSGELAARGEQGVCRAECLGWRVAHAKPRRSESDDLGPLRASRAPCFP